MIQFLTDKELYETIIQNYLPKATRFLWLGTSDLKDMYVHYRNKMVPLLYIFDRLISNNVSIRLIHAKEPGPNFKRDFDKYPLLLKNLERICCPRIHFKTIVIDGKYAYIGSANITGAGIGAKGSDYRNFENGIFTDDSALIEKQMNQFDELWMGKMCISCKRKEFCVDQINKI